MRDFWEMSNEELRKERDHWQNEINNSPNWGAAVAAAIEFRDECEKALERRGA